MRTRTPLCPKGRAVYFGAVAPSVKMNLERLGAELRGPGFTAQSRRRRTPFAIADGKVSVIAISR